MRLPYWLLFVNDVNAPEPLRDLAIFHKCDRQIRPGNNRVACRLPSAGDKEEEEEEEERPASKSLRAERTF